MIKIAHTADVHWRGLSRHDEYREVFQAFIEGCKENSVDHIFIGGDIFHTKTSGISPEYIDQLSWWLHSMSQVAHVHLILGNHDGNLVNLSRQDAVTPIVKALNNDRVTLYKKSGVYKFHEGYNWCVFSLFDEQNWNLVKPQPGMVNIACYHGPVRGSVTEVGWDIEEGITTDFFSEYDFALLGDIHKRQFLGYRNGKPWIGYPGTPLQQNYAEDMEHGYLLWEIEESGNWDVSFKKLPNPKPFVTINWDGSLDKLQECSKSFPLGTRFRIRSSEHISQKDAKQITTILTSSRGASEVTYKSDFVIDRSVIKAGASTLGKADLRSADVLLKLAKDHHKSSTITEKTWSKVHDSIKNILFNVSSTEEVTRNSKWSLRQLSFDNMFTYGEDNSINFDALNGIVGIFGSNRIGKSSIVGTIMYSLFNTTDRGPMKNVHICNIRKQYCSSRAVLNHDGTDYVVERQTTKSENKRGITTASTSLNLYKIDADGEAKELNGEQRTDTEKIIRSLIGTHEDFLMTSLSAQGETNQFLMQGSSKRRATLSRFLDLDIFDKMYDIANKEANGYKSQLKNYPDKDWNSTIEQKKEEITSITEEILETEASIQEKRSEISKLQADLLSIKDTSLVTQDQVEAISKKVSNLSSLVSIDEEKLNTLNSEINDLQKKISTIENVKKENDITELRSQKKSYSNLETSLINLKHSFEKEDAVLKQQQKSLKILDEVPCGDQYSHCKFIKDAHQNKEKIHNQEASVKSSKDKLEAASAALKSLKDTGVLEKLEKLEKLIELSSKLELDISKKENELTKVSTAFESKSLELRSAKEKLLLLEEAIKKQDNIEAVTIKSNLEIFSKALKELDAKKFDLATKKGKLAAELEKLVAEKAARDSLLDDLKVFDLISSAFSKKGIPLVITKSQLPVINSEIAKILHGIVEFSVELENDEESDSSEIYINYGDSRRIIELCSGMEKTIASIAVRVAMINVSTLPRSDMFIIDEGFGTLDDSAVEACNRLLVSLKKYFKTIVVITHVDGIKDVVDHVLEITKVEKDAKVVYGV